MEQAQIASSFVAAAAAGQYAQQANSQAQANITGQVSYDLDRLCGLVRPYLGPNIIFAGRGASQVSWRGPMSLASAQASAGLKWNSADIYGFQVGPGEIKPVLSGGVLQIEPAELSVSQGKLHLAPQIRLSPQPMELTLPAGHLVEQVQINPRMCTSSSNSWPRCWPK